MNPIIENFSLKPYNTFGIEAKTKYFVEINQIAALKNILATYKDEKKLVLGGGSNILLLEDFSGITLKINLLGIEQIRENADFVWLKAGAGVVWHTLVQYCIEQNYGGMENLSLIPGTVGAAPMQNIGAYGVELKEVFESLEAFSLINGEIKIFSKEACHFGYRESVFKKELKNQYIITAVTFKVSKNPEFNISYGGIQQTLAEMQVEKLSVKAISEVVCKIRRSKLPDPAQIGNAGSFFKNPEISTQHLENLKANFPSIISYPLTAEKVKVPAGWLIEQCGWKGRRIGNTGVHPQQALVLVNYGGATGKEILALAQQIQASVKEKFAILLDMEVNVIK